MLQIGTPLDQRVTEKGVLQLLFDARFLRNALASSPADSSADSAAAGSRPPAETKRAFAALEASLQVVFSSFLLLLYLSVDEEIGTDQVAQIPAVHVIIESPVCGNYDELLKQRSMLSSS